MTQFFRDFSEYTPGDLATVGAADWTASTLVGDWQLDVVADAGPGGIPALVSSRTVSGDALTFARFTASETAGDIEVFARHSANAYSVNIGFGPTLLQADNAAYALAAVSATEVRLWRFGTTGGTSGNIATATFSLVAGTAYNIRLGRSGTTIRAKIWAVGESEPGTWMMQGTDTALGTVQGGVYARKFELQPQITTAFGVGTAGDEAPTSGGAPDTTAPTYSVAPAVASTTPSSVTITATAGDETSATVDHYAVAVADGATAPSGPQIVLGQDSTGSAALSAGSDLDVTGGAEASITLAGLASPATAYDIYTVVADESGNLATPVKLDATTAALPAINTSASFSSGLKLVGSGALVTDESGVRVDVWRNDTGALVLHNQTIATIASGHLSFSHASLPAGVSLHIKAYPTGVLPVAWDQTPA